MDLSRTWWGRMLKIGNTLFVLFLCLGFSLTHAHLQHVMDHAFQTRPLTAAEPSEDVTEDSSNETHSSASTDSSHPMTPDGESVKPPFTSGVSGDA